MPGSGNGPGQTDELTVAADAILRTAHDNHEADRGTRSWRARSREMQDAHQHVATALEGEGLFARGATQVRSSRVSPTRVSAGPDAARAAAG